MKSIRNIALAAVAVILASCMGNYDDEPTMQLPPYGNNNINEENIISIGKLKQMFDKQLSTDQRDGVSYAQVLNDIKIRGWVTANDIEGNIYNEIGLSDDTGAILVCISQGGLFGYLPVGTEIIIDLNELYVGAYGLQPEIGTPYTNKNGLTYVSRMSRTLWASHFKIVGAKPAHEITPMTFDKQIVTDAAYLKENCGKANALYLGLIACQRRPDLRSRGREGCCQLRGPTAKGHQRVEPRGAHKHLCRLCSKAAAKGQGQHHGPLHSLWQHMADTAALV